MTTITFELLTGFQPSTLWARCQKYWDNLRTWFFGRQVVYAIAPDKQIIREPSGRMARPYLVAVSLTEGGLLRRHQIYGHGRLKGWRIRGISLVAGETRLLLRDATYNSLPPLEVTTAVRFLRHCAAAGARSAISGLEQVIRSEQSLLHQNQALRLRVAELEPSQRRSPRVGGTT